MYPLQVNIPFPTSGEKQAKSRGIKPGNGYPEGNLKVEILVLRLRLGSLNAPNYNLFDSGTAGVDRLDSASNICNVLGTRRCTHELTIKVLWLILLCWYVLMALLEAVRLWK